MEFAIEPSKIDFAVCHGGGGPHFRESAEIILPLNCIIGPEAIGSIPHTHIEKAIHHGGGGYISANGCCRTPEERTGDRIELNNAIFIGKPDIDLAIRDGGG